MAAVAAQYPTRTGAALTYSAVNASDTFKAGVHTLLHVKNGSGASITVTLTVVGSYKGHPVTITATTVPAGGDRIIGVMLPELLANGNGDVTVTYSAITTVTAAVINAVEP